MKPVLKMLIFMYVLTQLLLFTQCLTDGLVYSGQLLSDYILDVFVSLFVKYIWILEHILPSINGDIYVHCHFLPLFYISYPFINFFSIFNQFYLQFISGPFCLMLSAQSYFQSDTIALRFKEIQIHLIKLRRRSQKPLHNSKLEPHNQYYYKKNDPIISTFVRFDKMPQLFKSFSQKFINIDHLPSVKYLQCEMYNLIFIKLILEQSFGLDQSHCTKISTNDELHLFCGKACDSLDVLFQLQDCHIFVDISDSLNISRQVLYPQRGHKKYQKYFIIIVQYLRSMSLEKCIVLLKCGEQIYKIIEQLQIKDVHCFSSILTISEYLSANLNGFPDCPITIDHNIQQIYKSEVYQPRVEIWNQYIKQLFIEGHAMSFQQNIYVLVPVEKFRQEIMNKDKIFENVSQSFKGLTNRQILFKISSVNKDIISKRKALFLCQSRPPKEMIRSPTIEFSSIMLGSVFNNDEWVIYDLPNMQKAPKTEQLQCFHSIFVSGSLSCAYNLNDLFFETFTNLHAAYLASSTMKLMGICFGHQVLSRFFGGQIGKNKHETVITNIQQIQLKKQIVERYDFLKQLTQLYAIHMTALHEDEVYKAPQNFEIWSSSQNTPIEGLISKDQRILTTQFHSEITYQYMRNKNELIKSCGHQELCFEFDQSAQAKMRNSENSKLFLKIMRKFLQ